MTSTNKNFVVHMNGTSAAELETQFRAVFDAACTLRDALQKASPNMRDYYPLEFSVNTFHEDKQKLVQMIKEVQSIADWAVDGVLHARGD